MEKLEGHCFSIISQGKLNPELPKFTLTKVACPLKPDKKVTWNSYGRTPELADQKAAEIGETFRWFCEMETYCYLKYLCETDLEGAWKIEDK